MIDAAALSLFKFMFKASKQNIQAFFVVVLLVTNAISFSYWNKANEHIEVIQTQFAVIERSHEREKRQIKNHCDSLRYIEFRFFDQRQDSITKVLFIVLNDKKTRK